MLQFILGRASSGKSREITAGIRRAALKGEKPVLLVPEQFSFESERAVLNAVGDALAQQVTVLSFTRLCDELERLTGIMGGRLMTDADRSIIMGRAVSRAAEELRVFKRYSASQSFSSAMLDVIGEFKTNAVTPEMLFAAASASQGAFADKLCDIAHIYTAFEQLTAERFLDPDSRLALAYERLGTYPFFKNRPVFADSFKGFTGQQYKILSRIISSAKSLTVALCMNTEPSAAKAFENTSAVKQRITRLADTQGVPVAEDILLCETHYESSGLSDLERLMAYGSLSGAASSSGVTLCRAKTVFDEAEFAARTIRRIVRESGARFNDFVIIARESSVYEQALDSACRRNNVNCFIDRRVELISTPPAVCALAAVQAAIQLNSEHILKFHKSGINLLTVEEISELENYVYLWNIDGELFCREWNMNPEGFVADRGGSTERLARLNSLRRRAIGPLLSFKSAFCGSAKDRAAAIYSLLDSTSAARAFKAAENDFSGDELVFTRELLRRSWRELMLLLDSLAVCFGEQEISSRDFYNALKNAAASVTIGIVPQTLDEVTFGTADRIRPSRPKYAFILGAAQGVFPRALPSGRILTSAERARLIELGIEIPDCASFTASEEEFLVYSNVCCASRGVFITCPEDYNGTAVAPSAFVNTIAADLSPTLLYEPSPLSAENLPETERSAFSELCRRMGSPAEAQLLFNALEGGNIGRERLNSALGQINPPEFSLKPETARELFGDNIRMSASKFDDFSRCRFMYFCRDGLNIRPLQPASFDALQRGTLVHYVLQRITETHKKELSSLTAEEISQQIDLFTDEYLNSVVGYRSVENTYLKYLVSVIKRSLNYVVGRLALEFAQSDFTPVRCELAIGAPDGIPAIEIPLSNGAEITLRGSVDRVDRWNGYVRIIDYKTGSRSFKLPDILFGQNMQMLIYLYAVCKSNAFGGSPAGILYMPASRKLNATAAERRMNGVILGENQVHAAMEKENRGEFVPRLTEKSESHLTLEDFESIFSFIEKKLTSAGEKILSGDISASPVDSSDSPACKYCDFSALCRIKDARHTSVPKLKKQEVLEQIEKEVKKNGN